MPLGVVGGDAAMPTIDCVVIGGVAGTKLIGGTPTLVGDEGVIGDDGAPGVSCGGMNVAPGGRNCCG